MTEEYDLSTRIETNMNKQSRFTLGNSIYNNDQNYGNEHCCKRRRIRVVRESKKQTEQKGEEERDWVDHILCFSH